MLQMFAGHSNAAESGEFPVIQHDRLSEHAVDIQSDDSNHLAVLLWSYCQQKGAGGHTATTDPRSQRIRASRTGGQITARARSPWFKGRPARTRVLPTADVPDGRTIVLTSAGQQDIRGAGAIMPDNGQV